MIDIIYQKQRMKILILKDKYEDDKQRLTRDYREAKRENREEGDLVDL